MAPPLPRASRLFGLCPLLLLVGVVLLLASHSLPFGAAESLSAPTPSSSALANVSPADDLPLCKPDPNFTCPEVPPATATPSSAPLTWFSYFTQSPHIFIYSLWCSSVVFRALFLATLVTRARWIFDKTRFTKGPSLAHWAGTILAHRGYRSEAQQFGRVAKPASSARRASRAASQLGLNTPGSRSLSRRMSRDEGAINPLLAASAALLTEKTVGGTPRSSSGTPFARQRSLSNFSTSGTNSPRPSAGLSRVSSSLRGSPAPEPDRFNYNIPENSLLAFIYAHENGTHAVEVDVVMTKDQEVIVMHDSTLDRTMEASGGIEVPELTLEQIRSYKYRRVTDQEYVVKDPRNKKLDWTKVPTLEEIVIFCRERHLRLMIETKEYVDHHTLRGKIAALFKKYDMYEWSFVATFNPWHLYWYRKEHPTIPTCLLYCRTCTEWCHRDASKEMVLPSWMNTESVRMTIDWLLWYFSPTYIADWLGVSMVGPHNILVSPALITSLTTRGIVCDVWCVNSELEKSWLKSLGCIVTTDRLFSLEDVSPFADSEGPEVRMGQVGQEVAPMPPSMHAAEEFVASSYYINHPDAAFRSEDSESGSEPNSQTASDHEGEEEDAARGSPTQEHADLPQMGRGRMGLKHLRTGSADPPIPLLSPLEADSADTDHQLYTLVEADASKPDTTVSAGQEQNGSSALPLTIDEEAVAAAADPAVLPSPPPAEHSPQSAMRALNSVLSQRKKASKRAE